MRARSLAVVAMLAASGAVVVAPPAAFAAPPNSITVAKTAPSSVLVGDPVDFTLSATNPNGNAPAYNVSFRDVLPAGVTYRAGSTTPSDIGDPTVVNGPGAGEHTLIWSNAFDLQPGATSTLKFSAVPDPDSYPVGRPLDNTTTGYASKRARYVPKFDANGNPVADARVYSATSNQTRTVITALAVTKAEPSPEHDVLRGIHDQPTVYTLTTTNNGRSRTDDVTVTDFIPAEFEFLGCGQTDNTSGGAVEYPGAPRLTDTPAVADCIDASTVTTVSDPPGYPAGVYTKVVWDLGSLAAGQTATIKYAAGIPLRKNVLFPAGTGTAGVQTANLDNNTGAPTRQDGAAAASTNHVQAAGDYQGAVFPGASAHVTAQDDLTVTVNDVRIHKSVSPSTFTSGGIATYTLTVDVGEYEDASNIVVTDTLPNGVCPLSANRNYTTGAPADCAAVAGRDPSVGYDNVTQNPNGTFTIRFAPIDAVAANGTTTITYYGRMRTTYTGGALAGQPTSAGDAFTNNAEQVSDTDPIPANDVDTETNSVTDPTSATQTTGGPSLTKEIGQRDPSGMNCDTATYVGLASPIPPPLTFAAGDRVCFRITVSLAGGADTLDPVLTDLLPDDVVYEDGSATTGTANDVPDSDIAVSSDPTENTVTWTLGHPTANGQQRVLTKGSTFQAVFSAIVTGTPQSDADLQGNLAKYRQVDSSGAAVSLRDRVDLAVAPTPLGITKGVSQVDGTTYNPPGDDKPATEGARVTYVIPVSNTSDATSAPPAQTMSGIRLWDVLPPGFACADVQRPIADGGTCTDPGDAAQPSFTGNDRFSAILWNGGVTIAPGASHDYTYTVIVPAGAASGTRLVNTASVRSYDLSTDRTGVVRTHYPANNVDTSLGPDTPFDDAPASDPSAIDIPAVGVSKGVTSAVNEANNVGAEVPPASSTTVVPGESATYTVIARVPANTTVYSARFTDPLPAGLTCTASSASFAADATAPTYTDLPAGVTFAGCPGQATPTISFGTAYDNTGPTDQLFRMTITVTAAAGDTTHVVNGAVLANNATFAASANPAGGSTPAPVSATATTNVAEPRPALAKTNNRPGTVAAGDTVTYTLVASNATGRPPLHDSWVVDCLPAGLTFAAFGAIPAGTSASTRAGSGATQPRNPTTGCKSGYTEIDWNAGDIAPGASKTLTYTATVDPTAVGSSSYVNLAGITGTSLAGERDAPTDSGTGRSYAADTTSTVTVAPAGITKSASPTNPTVGERVTYTTTVTLPANVNFYNLSVIDQLPAGIATTQNPQPATATCVNPDNTTCGITTATPLTANGQTIGWTLGDATAASQARTVTLRYVVQVADVAAAQRGATLTNRATVKWDDTNLTTPTRVTDSFDRTGGTATAAVVVREPAMSIGKSVDTARPAPGDTFHYTVVATNSSAANTSPAYNVAVTDRVPTGVVVDPASISDNGTISGTTTNGGGTISWTVAGPVAPGASVSLTYSATLAASGTLDTSALRNTATLQSYTSLASGGRTYSPNATAPATVTPNFPHVTVTKAATDGPTAYLGQSYRWTFVVTNDPGAAHAYAVSATDRLPPNWTFDTGSATVAVNGAAPTATAPTVSVANGVRTLSFTNLGGLDGGQSLVVTYTATPTDAVVANPGVGRSVDQTNTVTPGAQDATGATGNATGSYGGPAATATTHIDSADLAIDKTVGAAPIAGGSGSWTLTVRNNGPDTAVGPFTVRDPFNNPAPDGVVVQGAAGTGWTCSGAPIVCTHGGTLASLATLPVITVSYTVDSDVADGTTFANTATVRGTTYDGNPSNNTDTATAGVTAAADLGITKTLSDPPLVPGQHSTYRISVVNYGPSTSRGPIAVTDTLPVGATFVSSAGTGWGCPSSATDGRITCTYGDLPVGQASDLDITVSIPTGTTADVVNMATVRPTTDEGTNTHPDTSSVTTTPRPSADLVISKILRNPPLVAGAEARYTVRVVNNGPSDSARVYVTDTLPAQETFVGVEDDTGWDCSATAGRAVRCDLSTGPLAPGAANAVSFTLVVRLGQQITGVDNTATVHSDTTDPNPSNNSSTSNGDVTARADLTITKSHTGSVVAGGRVSFTLAVHNNGPSDEAGPNVVTDVLPDGLDFASADGTGWSCSYADATRTVTCTGADGLLADADAQPITLVATVPTGQGAGSIYNAATVAGNDDSPDPVPGNNSSTDEVPVDVSSHVTLDKTLDTATPVVAGDDATFTLTVTNDGPSDATTVVVTDTLPQYLSYASATGDGWTCEQSDQDAQLISCVRARIPAGTGHVSTITVVAHTDPAAPDTTPPTTVDNVATVDIGSPGTTTQPDPVPVPLVRRVDLSLTKTASPDTVAAGQRVTWQIAVTNHGPSTADTPVTVTDTLPAYQSFVSAAGAGWTCTPGDPPATQADRQDVTCTRATPLGPDTTDDQLAITALIAASAPVGTQTNTATVTTPTTELTPGDNTGTGDVTVARSAILSVTKTHTGPVAVGAPLTFTLTVHNAGPSTADQVVIADDLPDGLTFVSSSGDGWTCSADAARVNCALAGTVAANTDAVPLQITTSVGPAAYPGVTNTATVSSTDPQLPGSDTGSDTVPVPPAAQLRLTKKAVGSLVVGRTGSYRLVVTNDGPTPSPGPIVVTDPLPAGLRYVSGTGDGWTCAASGTDVTCRRDGALAVGDQAVVVLAVDVGPAAYPSVQNTARVTGPGSDTDAGTATTPVRPESTLQVTKTVDGVQGATATYSIAVTNTGPNPTDRTTYLVDPMPDGLSAVGASGDGWTCAVGPRRVTCAHADSLRVGQTATVVLRATITAAPDVQVVNVARALVGSPTGGSGVDSAASNPATVSRPSGTIASTGVPVWPELRAALWLLLGGVVLVISGVRRRRSG